MDFKQFYKTINFDIDNEIRTVFQATQGDTKSRGLLVDLIVGGVKTPVTTENMTFYALKPDGTRVMTVGIKEGTGFRIDFTNQTFAVAGVLLCTLVLSGTNGEKIADKKFKMTVDSSLEDGAIISEDERGILDRAFDLASDIVPRLEGLDVPLLENLEQEVTLARGTEPTLGARLDGTDAQLADIVDKQFKMKNLVGKNKSDWLIFSTDYWQEIVEEGNIWLKLTFTPTGGNSNYRLYKSIPTNISDKIYVRALAKSNHNNPIKSRVFVSTNFTSTGNYPPETTNLYNFSIIDEVQLLSGVGVATDSNVFIILNARIETSSTGTYTQFSQPITVNLTEVFGSGNEPTKEEMDELMKVIPNGWWDGELTLTQKQFVTWQLNLIRKNTNAIIALGGTII